MPNPYQFLSLFLLPLLLSLSTISTGKECCYSDACDKTRICGEVNGTLTDSCGITYVISPTCELARQCCYSDACNKEKICSHALGTLEDSCDAVFDVGEDCALVRKSVSPSPTPATIANLQPDAASAISSLAVCIHGTHLMDIPSHRLLYARPVLASMLCDAQGSCATPGHMVLYQGRGMRMTAYCGVVGCTARKGLVNSPVYERGLRIESLSEGLVFTALAARFATKVEEVVLAGVIRAGF